jgi:hypothetical protein
MSEDESEDEPKTAFPDPDNLELNTVSPGGAITQELERAPIFGDITESASKVAKGKERESYLPLNPSPTIPKQLTKFVTMASTSKEEVLPTRATEHTFGLPSLNPMRDYSPFTSTFAPMKRTLPIGLCSHQTPSVTTEGKDDKITNGGLKGEGPEKYQGDKDKAREFMRDFVIWWMQNKNNRAFRTPLSRIALFLGKLKGVKVTDWVSHMLQNIADEVNNDPSLEEDESLWTDFAERFELKFTSASALEESRQEFEECCMKNDDVDEYIAIFEDLLTKIEYK